MEWSVVRTADEPWFRVTTGGTFTLADHARMVEEIVARPDWRPGTTVLFDHRALELEDASYAMMVGAGDTHRRHEAQIGDGKAAILVGSVAAFGTGRQFELLMEDTTATRIRIFLDEGEALAWLRT